MSQRFVCDRCTKQLPKYDPKADHQKDPDKDGMLRQFRIGLGNCYQNWDLCHACYKAIKEALKKLGLDIDPLYEDKL